MNKHVQDLNEFLHKGLFLTHTTFRLLVNHSSPSLYGLSSDVRRVSSSEVSAEGTAQSRTRTLFSGKGQREREGWCKLMMSLKRPMMLRSEHDIFLHIKAGQSISYGQVQSL